MPGRSAGPGIVGHHSGGIGALRHVRPTRSSRACGMVADVLLEPLMEADNLPDHGTLRTFLAPCLLVVVSVLSLAGVSA